MPDLYAYTDGACSGNPGPGGWATILKNPASGKIVELTGSDPETTNNRMEMMAVLEGLRRIKKAPSKVHVVSDSNYVIKGLTVTPLGERYFGIPEDIAGKTSGSMTVVDFGPWPGNSPELGVMLVTNGDRGTGARGGATADTEAMLFLVR